MNQLCLAVKILLIGLLFAVPVWAGDPNQPEPWDTGGGSYEADPADGDAVGQGDDHFRAMKREIRDRVEVEHHFGSVVGDDTGLHRLGSGRCFYQSAVPTALEVADHDNDGLGPGDTTLANQDYQSQEIKGLGRCWVDSDTQTLYAYGTSEIEGSGATSGWFPVSAGKHNLLYNGSFEIDNGSGVPDGWTNDDLTPDGWTNDDLTIVAGSVADVSDDIYGLGFAFTGTGDGDGTLNDNINQTLTGLHAGATYIVYGAYIVYGVVNPTAGDTCSIVTTGAGTQASVTTTNAGGFEVLLDTFVVADPTVAVVVRLESDAAADVCEWDHVAVIEYEQRRQLPERLVDGGCIDWNTTSAQTITDIEALTVRVQIPWPKSVIRVTASMAATIQGGVTNEVDFRVFQSIDGGASTVLKQVYDAGTGYTVDDWITVEATGLVINPTVGSEYVYSIVVNTGGAFDALGTSDNCLWLEAYPL
jgi:hypothetical protein